MTVDPKTTLLLPHSIMAPSVDGMEKRLLFCDDRLKHSVLTRGALGEVVNLTKPMIESGLGGLDRPCASLITLCSSHLGHFYGQKLPKNGHIWVHRP